MSTSPSSDELGIVEQRLTDRDGTEEARITSFVDLPDGTALEGVAKDISDGGVRISGPTTGLKVGDEVDVLLVVLEDQKVHYRAEVRHVDPEEESYGLKFTSRPQPVEGREMRRCRRCRREYSSSANFCPICGEKLRRA
jgi:rRNA maturation endonuclease Nob1